MEIEEKEAQKLDLYILLEDFLRQARRMWILGVLMVLCFGAALGFLKGRSFTPMYQAYASFTPDASTSKNTCRSKISAKVWV